MFEYLRYYAVKIFKVLLSWSCYLVVYMPFISPTTRDLVPRLHGKESSLTKHLVRRRGLLNRPFRPPLILINSYVQTLFGLLCNPLGRFEFEREYLQMADKGVVAIDWYVSSAKLKRNSPILLIFPRLTGDAISVGQICKLGSANGMRAVVINRRGHGASFMTTAKMTSTGDTKDTRKVVEYIFNNYPYVHIVGVGVGAGCAALLSYLGEYGSSSHLKAAVNISPSYDNTEKLCEQIPKFYELFLLFDLKILLLRYWKTLYKVIDLKSAILKSWTLKEFDYHVYCKIYGIETFESFWCRNDPMRDVDDISVPVLCINSLDDPVSVKEDIPVGLFEFYPNLLLITVDKGGHCAFLENTKGESWAAHLAINFVDGVLEFIANSKFWHR